ncbi:MAG: UDP-glucose dehydrogenase family protein [Bacillota bacterium]
MKVTVIGAGYVGLVAACCLVNSGHQVMCIERDEEKRNKLLAGVVPFYEEGLEDFLVRGLASGRLTFGTDICEGMDARVVMVAVGTPSQPDGRIDLSQIYEVVRKIAQESVEPMVLVMKSTVPPGLGLQLQQRFLNQQGERIAYVSNPEFLREGQAVRDWYHPDRIVLGGDNQQAVKLIRELYHDIDASVCEMDISSAEMVKYASNAFLATKISFINEIANLCERVKADIEPVAWAVGMDNRIGRHFLQAGLGYGGSCFPKDTKGLDFISTLNGHTFNLLKAVIEVNSRQRIQAVRKLSDLLGTLCGKKIAVLGVAFKPNTDDIRESPALDIIRILQDEGAEVHCYDPMADPVRVKLLLPEVYLGQDIPRTVEGCHAVVVVTEWREFIDFDWQMVKERMIKPYCVLDGRNCLNAGELRELGFQYMGIGRR